jgi:hypothetical protein
MAAFLRSRFLAMNRSNRPSSASTSLNATAMGALFDFVERKPNRQDVTTAGLARMNMILHDFPTANIVPGNHCGQGQRNRARPVRMEKI